MPKTVTSDFENVQARPAFPVEFELVYKRRYWDTGTSKYIWEASWQDVDKSDIRSFSVINQKLDTVQLNQLLSSNVSPTLNNAHHVWEEGYNWSKFNADGVATDGYLPYLTKIQIRGGFLLDDGTTEVVNLFTGYAVKFATTSKDDTVRATSEGRERILKDANAENVSTSVDNETPAGAIDGSNKVFTTLNNGVAKITEVIVDGSEIEVGKDCSVSDLNEPDLPATITCNVAPATSITEDYFYWKQDELFEDLVVDLLQEAGLTGADYTVDPVVFPNDVLNTWEQTTKAHWDAGETLTDVDTFSTSGDVSVTNIFDDFADGSYSDGVPRTWTPTYAPSYTIDTGRLKFNSIYGGVPRINTPSSQAYGTWEFDIQLSAGSGAQVWFIYVDDNNYYYLTNLITDWVLRKWDSPNTTTLFTGGTVDNNNHKWRITRAAGGVFKIYQDNVYLGTATDNTHTTSNSLQVVSSVADIWYDNFRLSSQVIIPPHNLTATGIVVTQGLDTGAGNPKSWNLLDYTVTTPSGTSFLFETISSTTSGYPGDAHADWIAISVNRQINSAVKRYLWVRVTFYTNAGRTASPTLHDLTVNYATTSSLIALANFTGQSVFDAISELAKMPDYEIGFDADEKFFFRQKASSEIPDFIFNESDGLIEVLSRYEDFSRLYNWIRVTYGAYTKDVTPITEGDSQPHSFDKYGKRKLSVSGGQIVISESADIATGIAQTFFERYKLPRIVMKIKVKYYPQINLSDVVQVRFDPKKEIERLRWDDGVSRWDDGVLRWDGFRTQVIDYLTCKVTGIAYNIDASQVTLDLEEIL